MRVASLLIATLFVGISTVEAERFSRWYQERSANLRTVVLGIRDAAQGHPGRAFLLQGVDDNLFQSGFQENPFRLIDVEKVYLVPGSEQGIQARADLGGLAPWQISPAAALTLIERGQAVVLHVSKDRLTDVTQSYESVLHANPRSHATRFCGRRRPVLRAAARTHLVPRGQTDSAGCRRPRP